MLDFFGLAISTQTFFSIMVSLAFFVGIVLMISPEAFASLHKALQKEYGLKKRLIPGIEDTVFDAIDKFLVQNQFFAGLMIAVTSFVLLLVFR